MQGGGESSSGIGKHLRRAAIIGSALAAGVTMTNAGRRRWADTIWKPDGTELGVLPESQQLLDSGAVFPEAWVVFSGLGRKSGEADARLLAHNALKIAQKSALVTYINYPNHNIDKSAIARKLQELAKTAGALSIYGHSAGSLIALESLAYMEEKVPVLRFITNGSPSSARDVIRRWPLRLAALLGQGDPMDRFLFTLLDENPSAGESNPLIRMRDRLVNAWGSAMAEDPPPKMYLEQLKKVNGINVSKLTSDLEGKIGPYTHWCSVVSKDDETVLAVQAAEGFRQFATNPRLNAQFSMLTLPVGAGHANTEAASLNMGDWLAKTDPSHN